MFVRVQNYIKKGKIPHFSFDSFLTLCVVLFKCLENNNLNDYYIKVVQREMGRFYYYFHSKQANLDLTYF